MIFWMKLGADDFVSDYLEEFLLCEYHLTVCQILGEFPTNYLSNSVVAENVLNCQFSALVFLCN